VSKVAPPDHSDDAEPSSPGGVSEGSTPARRPADGITVGTRTVWWVKVGSGYALKVAETDEIVAIVMPCHIRGNGWTTYTTDTKSGSVKGQSNAMAQAVAEVARQCIRDAVELFVCGVERRDG
jgi:hypothetical protein